MLLVALALATTVGLALSQHSGATPSASTYAWRNVPIKGGGFVSGIIMHPTQQNLIYARTDVGGVFRWNEATNTWIPITDWIGRNNSQFMGVDSLAIDPSDPNRVYAAVGQYTQVWANTAALLRSSDQGASWQITNLPFKLGGNEDGRSNGERLAVDPNSNNILYLGTRNTGLWKSTDYGATWNQVSGFPVTSTANGVGLVLVQFLKSSGTAGNPTQTIYVGASQTGNNLFRSSDGGATWDVVAGQPASLMPHHAALEANGLLYLTYNNGPGPNNVTSGAVWKYATGDGSWANITPPTGQGGFSGVSIDPQHSGTLVVTTIDRWFPRDQLYRSTDGGATWMAIFNNSSWDYSPAPWSSSPTPHWLGDVEIDPFNPNRVWFVTGYGVFASTNIMASATGGITNWVFRDTGLEETVPLSIASPPSGALLLSALGDIGGFRHDDLDSSPPVANYFTNRTTNTSIDFAEAAPHIVARVHFGNARGSYSTDGGSSWTDFSSRPAAATQTGPNGIAVSADGQTFVWLPKGGSAYYSTDRGATWQASSGGPTDPNSFQTMWPVADRMNSAKFYFYHVTQGRVYVSTDGGHTYSQTVQLPTDGGILRAAPGFEGHLWQPASSGLYRSTDSASNFSRVASVQEAYQVGFGKAATGQSYPSIYLWGRVNNVTGIFRSDDTAATWVRINNDQTQFGWINLVAGDPNVYGRVYLATGGRGIVVGEISVPLLVPDANDPTLALALDSVTFTSGPFPLTNNFNFSGDHRTRVMLFATRFDLLPSEDFHTEVGAQLRNQQGTVYNLPVEYVGKVPGYDWLTSVVVRLDEQVTDVGNLNITLTLRGTPTNTVVITTKP
jgi:photosystem II stability/assembly factor-like uncharacterized protein